MKRAIVLLVPLLLALPATARAFTLGVDLYGAWLQNASGRNGVGANLRLGQGVGIPGVDLLVEIGATYAAMASGTGADADTILGGFGGVRLGVGELVRPALYAHLGYAEYQAHTLLGSSSDGGGVFGTAGLALDLVLPVVSVGLDASYDAFVSGDFAQRPAWITAGVHAALSF